MEAQPAKQSILVPCYKEFPLRKESRKHLRLSKEASFCKWSQKGRIQMKVLSFRTGRKKILELEELGRQQKASEGQNPLRALGKYQSIKKKKKKGTNIFKVPTRVSHKRQAGHSFTYELQNETSHM